MGQANGDWLNGGPDETNPHLRAFTGKVRAQVEDVKRSSTRDAVALGLTIVVAIGGFAGWLISRAERVAEAQEAKLQRHEADHRQELQGIRQDAHRLESKLDGHGARIDRLVDAIQGRSRVRHAAGAGGP